MGAWNKIKGFFGREPTEEIRERHNNTLFEAMLSLGKEQVTVEDVTGIPSLMNCLEFIAKNVAISSIHLCQRKDGKSVQIPDDERVFLLNVLTGDTLTPYELKQAMVMDYFLHGEAWIYVKRKRNRVQSLHYVRREDITVYRDTIDPIDKDYKVHIHGKDYPSYNFVRILRNTRDGCQGYSIVDDFNSFLQTSLNTQRAENTIARSGGFKKGYIQSDRRLSPEAIQQLRREFEKLYESNKSSVLVLNEGLKFVEASSTSVEMQMNQNKESNRIDLSSIFGLPMDFMKTMDSDEAYNNAIKTSVLPVLSAMKSSLQRDLLLWDELKDGYYFDFDLSEILKGDTKSRYDAYDKAIKSGWLTVNEVREKESLEKIEGMDVLLMGLGHVVYDTEKKLYFTPNTKESTSLEEGLKKTKEELGGQEEEMESD